VVSVENVVNLRRRPCHSVRLLHEQNARLTQHVRIGMGGGRLGKYHVLSPSVMHLLHDKVGEGQADQTVQYRTCKICLPQTVQKPNS
jgi:hypothetical protein